MNRNRLIHIVMTALTLALTVALCLSALSLCRDGLARRRETGSSTEPIFTRERAAAQIGRVMPLFALWGVGLIAALAAGTPARAARGGGGPAANAPTKGVSATGRRAWARAGLCAAALTLIALGILNGGLNDVLVKAINICTECIGLG